MTDLSRWGLLGCSAFFLAASLASCGPASSTGKEPAVQPPPSSAPVSAKTADPVVASSGSPSAIPLASAAPSAKPFDPCEGSPPVPHPFLGILSAATCDQDMYLRMASVADQLGVQCTHCHLPLASDPKKQDYPPMTPKKETANWMHQHLMKAVKPVDGSVMKCRSCHTDSNGKPVAKILGNPRDVIKAQEWMSLVMVNKFVTAKGEKLKCKSCHVGNFSTPQFQAKVILRSEQIPSH